MSEWNPTVVNSFSNFKQTYNEFRIFIEAYSTQSELDSFFVKFKTLLRGEKDATLTLKSEAVRAVISLSVDLGHVLSEPGLLHHCP